MFPTMRHLFLLLSAAFCADAVFTSCGGTFKYDAIEVNNCHSPAPCQLIIGTNATIKISFKPNRQVSNITAKVYGIINGIFIPFLLPQPDACKDSGLQCPLQENQPVVYTNSIPVKSIYPRISLQIQWELHDSKEVLICSRFDAVIR